MTNENKDTKVQNPSAFPRLTQLHDRDMGGRFYEAMTAGGMTLRDYFAAKALSGVLVSEMHQGANWRSTSALLAYQIADAMLAERAK